MGSAHHTAADGCVIGVHEALHALTFQLFGGRPRLGFTRIGKIFPAISCTESTVRLTTGKYLLVGALPGVALFVVPALAVLTNVPGSGWLIVPAVVATGGAIGDMYLMVRALRTPAGTQFCDRPDELAIYQPPTA